ncbi:Dot/Icm T4SS effector AnkK/LegA5 [Legionella clemsonensis]|uniref:Substrate of the Dot/Icm secretion system n=1 Tax=Legionella clemsonensis TaxID=1867846 RepID=A0A222P4A9_9GAMM|nr:Dot/Icm T4SS effector AnkK/LegA5 [Legionella clemsonensis]ASQ46657.1 hypothetical protein clem_10555 [Legionella clemsonensis]
MPKFYDKTDITTGAASHSGHIVYKEALFKSTKKVVFKLNKHNQSLLSLFEASLTHLISLFLKSNLTPKQRVVRNEEGQIIGLAAEHFCYTAARRETLLPNFCSLKKTAAGYKLKSKKREKAEDIPIYFLNEFYSGFFADLYQAFLKGKVILDMESLASILCSAYTLEEDDLHKGNLGFYIVEREKKPRVVFFKIDNDLLLSNSLMSRYEARIEHWGHGEDAFKITARDLLEFPKLTDSKNHYWPTCLRYFVKYNDPKVYNSAETNAFIQLGKNAEFQQAKWRTWYSHILLQSAMVENYLERSLNKADPYERAQLALISQATMSRLSQLKAVLFSIEEFRHYVATVNNETLGEEIFTHHPKLNKADYQPVLNRQIEFYKELCVSENGFKKGDTPLHVAIRLGDYRYHETWGYFREFANQVNDKGEKPLDVAVKMAQTHLSTNADIAIEDPRSNPFSIMKHLLNEGVDKTKSYKRFGDENKQLKIRSYHLQGSPYLERAKTAKTAEDLIEVLRDIGEDYRFSLKMKKEISVYCLRFFLRNKVPDNDLCPLLNQLAQALNGGNGKQPRPELQFIRQLRSSLWIIRVIRGLLGGTSTQLDFNRLIGKKRKEIIASKPSCVSAFFTIRDSSNPNAEDGKDFNRTIPSRR